MIYTLWDTVSSNMVMESTDERSALEVVLESLNRNGAAIAESLALDAQDERGTITPIAEGPELVARARRELASASISG